MTFRKAAGLSLFVLLLLRASAVVTYTAGLRAQQRSVKQTRCGCNGEFANKATERRLLDQKSASSLMLALPALQRNKF
jgi:hypothetical protein